MRHHVAWMVAVLGSLVCSAPARAAEVTIGQPITQLLYNGDADYTFFVGANRWGAPSCPNAYYAQLTPAVLGRKQMLAIALAAKQSGATVLFQGACSSDANYFNVTYIIVQ
jgi:hypothetical protein